MSLWWLDECRVEEVNRMVLASDDPKATNIKSRNNFKKGTRRKKKTYGQDTVPIPTPVDLNPFSESKAVICASV